VFNGSRVIGATSPFFYGTDAAFDVRYVFVFAADVKLGPKVGSDHAASAFKFAVSKNVGDAKSAFSINAVDAL
jgi:hypothetical protein